MRSGERRHEVAVWARIWSCWRLEVGGCEPCARASLSRKRGKLAKNDGSNAMDSANLHRALKAERRWDNSALLKVVILPQ